MSLADKDMHKNTVAVRESRALSDMDWDLEGSLNPGMTLPEISRLEMNTNTGGGGSTASLLSGGVSSPGRKTMKEYEQQQKHLEEENFNLKLRVYMLEERLHGTERPAGPDGLDKSGEQIVHLKVQLASLREELAQKKSLLRCASDTLDKLERQNATAVQAERQRCQLQVAELQRQLEEAQSAAEREASATSDEQPYLHAFPSSSGLVAADATSQHRADELDTLEARMAELQAALDEMKQTVESRDRQADTLRHQLEHSRAAVAQLTARADAADEARQQLAVRERQQLDHCRQLQQQLTERAAESQQLRSQLEQHESLPRLEDLQRTCDQLTAGRAADGARIAELMEATQKADGKLKEAAANVALLKDTLLIVAEEHTTQVASLRAEKKRLHTQTATLVEELRKMHKLNGAKYEQEERAPEPEAAGATSQHPAPFSIGLLQPAGADVPPLLASEAHSPTPHEVQVYLLRTETQRKDRKIRNLVSEMKEMNNMLMKYRWEVKEVAEEENERLWTELEENKKLIKELQDEKMELVLEKERQIQRLLTQLKERGESSGGGSDQQSEQRDSSLAASDLELRQTREQLNRLRADTERSSANLHEAQTQAQSLRSQLAHACLQVRERDAEAGQLRQRLLQQRRLLDNCPDQQLLRSQLAQLLDQLCEQLAAPRPGPPDADAVGGAGEMAADSGDSATARSDQTDTGGQKTAALRAQVSELRAQAAAREAAVSQLEERAAAAERLRGALLQCERQLATAEARLSDLAPLQARLQVAEARLTEADQQLAQLPQLQEQLTQRERELSLAEGQLNEIAELRDQLAGRERQLAAAAGLRAELQQARELLKERDEEKTALLRDLDQLRREHERRAADLQQQFEATLMAPTVQQYQAAEERHALQAARLQRRLTEARAAAHMLQTRLEELADFLELLLDLERRGVLDLSCLTAQHLQQLQYSLTQSRELSQTLSQSVLLQQGQDLSLEASTCSLAVADMSSLHVPPLPEKQADLLTQTGKDPLEVSAAESLVVQKPTSKAKTKKARSKTTVVGKSAVVEDKATSLPPPAPKSKCSAKQASSDASMAETVPPADMAYSRPPVSARDTSMQTCSADTVERGQQAAAVDPDLQTLTSQLAAITSQLESRDSQLARQAALIAALRQQLAPPRPAEEAAAEAGGDTARLPGAREPLPGEVRDSFRWLVRRQRTTDRGSGTDTPPPQPDAQSAEQAGSTVERALSPILSVARAQSAELLQLERPHSPPVKLCRSEETVRSRAVTSVAGSEDSDTVQETGLRAGRTRPRTANDTGRDTVMMPPPPAGDFSESEAWSEPDRDVSLARIGLDQSSLSTRTESWLGTHSESDARHSRRRGRTSVQDVQELEVQIESLQQVKRALRAEVDIYQKVLPPGGDAGGPHKAKPPSCQPQKGVMVPMEVLAEIHSLQQQLERAIAANERIRRQMEITPRRADAAESPDREDLALALKITQEQLAEANERLEATQQRCDELRAKLKRAKENLRLAHLNSEQFKDKFVRVSDDMVRLRERFTQMEADRELSEDSWRRRQQQQESSTVRQLERELEQVRAAARHHEDTIENLQQQLQARHNNGSDKNTGDARASCSESQLLELNREKLRLLSERSQLATRGRLLRSESCLLSGERRQLDAQRRLEAAKWAGWEAERDRLLAENSSLREERGRLRRQLVTGGAEAARAARRRLQTEADQARQAEAQLAADHAHCERRLAELSRVMTADKQRLLEVSQQLEEVNAEMEVMKAKLNDMDEAGQSCPESTRSCDLPAAPGTPPGDLTRPRRSESEGHDAHHESDRTSAYSSPDLGIESDCNRCPSRSSQTVTRAEKGPDGTPSETEVLREERDQMESKLASTRAALQQALDKLTRADQRKARVERAIYRQLSKTHDILRRAKNNLAPPPDQ